LWTTPGVEVPVPVVGVEVPVPVVGVEEVVLLQVSFLLRLGLPG
jgi:hypothetical protein